MFNFGRRSLAVREGLHPMFHAPLDEVIKIIDFSLLESVRLEGKQNLYFKQGRTTVEYPESAHNPIIIDEAMPIPKVFAFDAMPYYPEIEDGVDWRGTKEFWIALARGHAEEAESILENIKRMRHLSGIIIGTFNAHGIPLINGADWDADNRFNDHRFVDSPHYQHRDWRDLRNGDC